jgi:hypothetical protein
MSCKHCTNEDGEVLLPAYGPAPHICYYKIPRAIIGQSIVLPHEQWPDNFIEDPEVPGLGVYFCHSCGKEQQEAFLRGEIL